MGAFKKIFAWTILLALVLSGCGAEKDIPEGKEFSLGTVTDGVYENTYLGVKFAPENWKVQNAGELQQQVRDTQALLEDGAFGKELQDHMQIMDMQAVSADGLLNTSIVFTELSATERLAAKTKDEEDVVDEILSSQDAMIEAYAEEGIQVSSLEKAAMVFAGRQRLGVKITATIQDRPCHMLQVYEQSLGEYSAVITMTSLQEDQTGKIAEMFESLNP